MDCPCHIPVYKALLILGRKVIWKEVFLGKRQDFKNGSICVTQTLDTELIRQISHRKDKQPTESWGFQLGARDHVWSLPVPHNSHSYWHVLRGELAQSKLNKPTQPRSETKSLDPNNRSHLAFISPCTLPSESVWGQPLYCIERISLSMYFCVLDSKEPPGFGPFTFIRHSSQPFKIKNWIGNWMNTRILCP